MDPSKLKKKIEESLQDAVVHVTDLTGTHDHYRLSIVSPAFEGMLPIKRHRLVNELLKEELLSGEVHALQLDTIAPSEK